MASNEKISIREFARRVGVSDTAIRKAIKAGKIARGFDKDGGRQSIDYAVALEEYSACIDLQKVETSKRSAKKKKSPKPRKEVREAGQPTALASAPSEDTAQMLIDFNQSRAEKMAYEAKIKKLEYEEREGLLVRRESVYKALFSIGKEVREAMQALPDRIIDDVMASSTRNEAHGLLLKAITAGLEALAESADRMDKELK